MDGGSSLESRVRLEYRCRWGRVQDWYWESVSDVLNWVVHYGWVGLAFNRHHDWCNEEYECHRLYLSLISQLEAS
jgi:hypothetical protein